MHWAVLCHSHRATSRPTHGALWKAQGAPSTAPPPPGLGRREIPSNPAQGPRPPWLCFNNLSGPFPSPALALPAAHTAVHPPELVGQTCRWDGLHFGAAPVPLRRCGLHEAAPPPRSAAAAAGGEASKTIFNLKIRNWSRLRPRRLIETKFKFLSSPFKHRGPS